MSSTTTEHDARARVIDENYRKVLEFFVMDGQTWLGSLLRSMAAVIKANFDRNNTAEYRKSVMEEFHDEIADPRFDAILSKDKPMSAVLAFGKLFGAAFEDMIDRTTGSMLFEPASISPFTVNQDGSSGRKRRHRSPSDVATTSSSSMRARPDSGAKAHRSIAIPSRRPPGTSGNYLKKPPPGHPMYSLPVTDFTFPRLITDPLLERRSRNGTPPNEMNQQYDPMEAQPWLQTRRPMFAALLHDSDSSSPPPQPKARAEKKFAMKTPKQEVTTPGAKRVTPKMKSVKKEDAVAEETVREWAVDCFEKQAVCFVCDKVCPNYHSVSNHLYHQHKGVCQKNSIFRCYGCNKNWSSFRGALGHVRTAIRMNGVVCKNKMVYVYEQQREIDEEKEVEQIDDIEEEEGARMEEEGEDRMEADANEDDERVIKAEVDEEEGNEPRAPAM